MAALSLSAPSCLGLLVLLAVHSAGMPDSAAGGGEGFQEEMLRMTRLWMRQGEPAAPTCSSGACDEGDADRGIGELFEVHEAMKRAFSSAQDYSAGNVRSCAEGYSWWRHNAQAPQQARACVERLLALPPRWRCIGNGCEECHSGPCLLAKRWETHGNLGEPIAPSTDEAVYAAACDASSTLNDTTDTAPLLARPLVVVLSAPVTLPAGPTGLDKCSPRGTNRAFIYMLSVCVCVRARAHAFGRVLILMLCRARLSGFDASIQCDSWKLWA